MDLEFESTCMSFEDVFQHLSLFFQVSDFRIEILIGVQIAVILRPRLVHLIPSLDPTLFSSHLVLLSFVQDLIAIIR